MPVTRPFPTNNEIKLSSHKYIVSRTDPKGVITYANDYFSEISGYKEFELVGKPHSIVRHPDMPKAIFFLLWKHIQHGVNISAVVKNMAKNGNYYWVVTDFEIRRNKVTGEISEYVAFRHSISKKVIKEIEPLYARMLEIEKSKGMDASVAFLEEYLEDKSMNYNQYIEQLAKPTGIAGKLYDKMKSLFS